MAEIINVLQWPRGCSRCRRACGKETLRASGIDTGGPAALGQRDRQAFANALDKRLNRRPAPN